MQLVVEHIHPQLLPDIDDEIKGILCLRCLKVVTELKTVLLEGKKTELTAIERGVELIEVASETALVHMAPDGCHSVDELHIGISVVDHAVQVFVDGEETDRLQVGQHVEEYLPRLLTRGEGINIEVVDVLLLKLFDGHEHRRGVEHHLHPFHVCRRQGGSLQGLPQIGSHRDAAFHHIGLIAEWLFLVSRVG